MNFKFSHCIPAAPQSMRWNETNCIPAAPHERGGTKQQQQQQHQQPTSIKSNKPCYNPILHTGSTSRERWHEISCMPKCRSITTTINNTFLENIELYTPSSAHTVETKNAIKTDISKSDKRVESCGTKNRISQHSRPRPNRHATNLPHPRPRPKEP
jgi:hypothetical protein